jgi:trk system potassium uptake protein TrkA
LRRIVPEGSKSEWRDASGAVQLCEFHPVSGWFGMPVAKIESITGARVAFITRLGSGLIPDEHTVFQDGDLLHMMVRDEDLVNVEKSFTHNPESAS